MHNCTHCGNITNRWSNAFHEARTPSISVDRCKWAKAYVRHSADDRRCFAAVRVMPPSCQTNVFRCRWAMHAINRTNKFVGSIRIPFPVPIVITADTTSQPLPPPLHSDVQSTPNWFYFHRTWARQSATVCNDFIIIIVDCIEPWSLLLTGNSRLCATPLQNVHVVFGYMRVQERGRPGEGRKRKSFVRSRQVSATTAIRTFFSVENYVWHYLDAGQNGRN